LAKSDFNPEFETTLAGNVSIVAGIGKGRREPALQQLRGPGAPRSFTLNAGETVIGRGTQSTIVIDSALLSRRHVALRRNGPEHSFEDLGSANGVYLNGVRAHAAVLHDGDTVQVGVVVFVFHESGE